LACRLPLPQVRVKTAAAEYACVRAAPGYKASFVHLAEQADIAFEVFQALSPSHGGSPQASLDEVVARLARSKVRAPRRAR
jgi:Cytosine specific DNA methyltransferase replication foci domain